VRPTLPDIHMGVTPKLLACTLLLAPLGTTSPMPARAAEVTRVEQELTRAQATALVQKRYAARVVRASISEEGGRRVYVFRLLSEGGKVWSVRIDARSGEEVP
jgi:hypothetical protein